MSVDGSVVEQVVLEVKNRSARGKGPARRLRNSGLIPAVVYGRNKDAQALSVNPDALKKSLKTSHGLNTVLTLKFDNGEQRLALLKDWETEMTTSHLLHADFIEISLDKVVRVKVPLRLVGKCKGVVDGGLLEMARHDLTVEALPKAIPTHVDIDVTDLGVGHSLHVQDLKLPEGVIAVYATNFTVVGVVAPREEKVETPVVAVAEGAAAGAAPAVGADGKPVAADAKAAAGAPAAGGKAPAAGAAKASAPAKEGKK